MGINEMKQKLQGFVQKMTARREDGERQPLSTMPNGSISGYQPRIVRRRPENEGPETHPAASFSGMVPEGVDPAGMPQFMQPPVQQPQPPQAPLFMGTMRQNPVQPQQPTGYQPRHQSPAPQQNGWNGGVQQPANTGYVPRPHAAPQAGQPVPPQSAPQPQPAQESNVSYFPGTVRDDEGNGYSMVLRVAQITGITSCYRLLEFMQNNEAMIVNAEQITDVMEANRCMDMLFGAAYAMNQSFERISGKMIYLIAPRHVQVIPFDTMRHMSEADMERRWPGASRGAQEPRFTGFAARRQEDFAPAYGQRAAAAGPQPGAYTDYGRFGGFGGRR